MTYNEFETLGNEFFDEYAPKLSVSARTKFLSAFATELEEQGVLTIEDTVEEGDDTTLDEDEL
jgi:hypothetical protein